MNKTIRRTKDMFKPIAAWLERRGFFVTLAVCVAVIVGSAIWSNVSPTESITTGDAADFTKRLIDVAAASTPIPTATPEPVLVKPLNGATVRPFSGDPIYQKTLDAYAMHLAVDIAASAGDTVVSPIDGKVTSIIYSNSFGGTIELTRSDGLIVRVTGVSRPSLTLGATVRAGDTIAAASCDIPAESLDEPHIHVEIVKGDTLFNPGW